MRYAFVLLAFCSAAAAQSKVDATAGWSYELANQGSGFANLNGWYGSLSYSVAQHLGVTVEHESYWGGFQNNSVNQHVWLGGVTWKLGSSEAKIQPFIQPLAGDTRNSSQGSIQHSFTFQLAGGFHVKLNDHLAFEIVPAEYVLNVQSGSPLNSYTAALGVQFSFGK